uniref:Mesoderm induction early response protein 3 n=1 Tax=Lygus hesperus TaxID=30085 RepID=A0A146L6B9_LYGHE
MTEFRDMEGVDSKEDVLKITESLEKLLGEDVKPFVVESEVLEPCIRVGPKYQAFVPDLAIKFEPYDNDLPYENEDSMQWSPHVLSSELVESYLMRSKDLEGAKSKGVLCDDEEALYVLLQCGHNVNEALRRCKLHSQTSRFKTMSPWSENECRGFEGGMMKFFKDFRKIQAFFVKTRSLPEVVEFYYFWKKTVRRDVFECSMKKDKKCLDYMDHFIEEDEDLRPTLGRRYLLKGSSTISKLSTKK